MLVPVIPFALTERLDIDEHDVQKWNSILLGVLGVTILAGSGTHSSRRGRTSLLTG